MSRNDIVIPIQVNAHNLSTPLSSVPSPDPSPLSTDAIIHHRDDAQELKAEGSWLWEQFSYLVYLAVFGIFGVIYGTQVLSKFIIHGVNSFVSELLIWIITEQITVVVQNFNLVLPKVLTRYGLQKLFGPEGVGATKDKYYMYLDLPSNMVGSFLMGWFGVVFKANISRVSDQLAVGLTTGYLGSLTTFSGWNQKMLELGAEGEWVFVVLGYFIGLFLVAYSIIFGVETAEGFKWILRKLSTSSQPGHLRSRSGLKADSFKTHMVITVVLLVVVVLFYSLSGSLEWKEFKKGGSRAQLLLACMVGPLGVWIRWFLAKKLNGQGLGENGFLKWLPFGTLTANVSAACVMALFAILKKVVNTQNFDTVAGGIQLGLMGCLSTVSTFIAEFHNMRESDQPWRAYAYAMVTILASFILGTLIYSVPFWINDYD